ncbi:hypothetical protein [Kitasatospora azatica]|uniref:hypothetical protein n=1 Tax=Kitasatospora azatica TaxID=58347 RepID=UPI00056B916C|nr:hypothetical protein [Kitasatospora azatica]
MGQTLSVRTVGDGVVVTNTGSADVTLVDVKTTTSNPSAGYSIPSGTEVVCVELKVKNTGTADLDTYPFIRARWNGKEQ